MSSLKDIDVGRLESIAIDLAVKVDEATDGECKDEWQKDLDALNFAIKLLK